MARDLKDDKDLAIAELSAQIEDLKSQLTEMTRTTKRHAASAVSHLQEQAADAVEDVRNRGLRAWDAASNSAERVRSTAVGYANTADTAVREHPATSMGVAVGVGFLLGLFLTRR